MPTVVLLGTLDTKGQEYDLPRATACASTASTCVLVDAGIMGEPLAEPDVTRAGGGRGGRARTSHALADGGDRGAAVETMARGAAESWSRASTRRAGSTGSSRARRLGELVARRRTRCARCPSACPKLMVSTVASGDTRPYVGAIDITMMYSVVDIAGVNRISARILTNAAGAIAGHGAEPQCPISAPSQAADRRLDVRRHDALRDDGRASGSRSSATRCSSSTRPAPAASRWRRSRAAASSPASLDVTTTELADELVGGVLSAGPDRLEAAGALGLPQVVSLGALDMVNFGPRETRARALRRPEPLRPQPDDHADADDARRSAASSAGRSGASSRRRPGRPRCTSRSRASR